MFINILFIGQQGSGKSTLITRFAYGTFSSNRNPTRGIDPVGKKFKVNNEEFSLLLQELPGQDPLGALSPPFLRTIHIFVFVVDLTNEKSLDFIKQCKAKIAKIAIDGNPLQMLIATKEDVYEHRQVKIQELADWAENMGLEFNETHITSSKNNSNIDSFFENALTLFQQKQQITLANPKEKSKAEQEFEDYRDLLVAYLSKQINRLEAEMDKGKMNAQAKHKTFESFRQAAIDCKNLAKLKNLTARVKQKAFQHRDTNCFTYCFTGGWWRTPQSYNEIVELFDDKNQLKLTSEEVKNYQTTNYGLDSKKEIRMRLLKS